MEAEQKKYTPEQLKILNGSVFDALCELEPVGTVITHIKDYFNLDMDELTESDRLKLCIEFKTLNAMLQIVQNSVANAESILDRCEMTGE